jgi:hypothetical protein
MKAAPIGLSRYSVFCYNRFMRRGALLLFALCAFTGAGAARHAPIIVGLRLAMTGDQALAVLRERHLALHATYKPCLSEYLAEHRNVVPIEGPGHCLQTLTARYAGGDLLVSLSEDLPDHPGRTRVTSLALNYVSDSAISEVMQQAGTPTLTDGKRPWIVAMWCFEFKCANMERTLNQRSAGAWLLVHRGSGLTLADNSLDSEPLLSQVLAKRGVRLEP